MESPKSNQPNNLGLVPQSLLTVPISGIIFPTNVPHDMFDMCRVKTWAGAHWLQREVANVCSKVPAVSRPVTFFSFSAHFQDPSPRLQCPHSPAPEAPASLGAGGGCYHGNKRLCPQGTHPQNAPNNVLPLASSGLWPCTTVPSWTGGTYVFMSSFSNLPPLLVPFPDHMAWEWD